MANSLLTAPLLAIESSCDETACAILSPEGRVLAETVHTQMGHAALGGVVPEIAARAHLTLLPGIVEKTLTESGLKLGDMGAFAACTGPGLIGGLIVGSSYAKGLAIAMDRPFIAVNHIEAHALTARLPGLVQHDIKFPYLLLLVSGGHCQCVAVRGVGQYEKLGGTIDDAAGEAFDKVAKLLGLGWPGGPALEKLALEGDDRAISLPRPLMGREGCDFSFSGLKTAVSRQIDPYGMAALPRALAADIAASFQSCVCDVMADRVRHALEMMPEAQSLVVAGGVAANAAIRAALEACADEAGIAFVAPPLRLCTDNAVMVGWAAIETIRAHEAANVPLRDGIQTAPSPRWPLGEVTAPSIPAV
ncbi:tRNA (adenosine(37)-N6)-threonylcarbamoyltransferase complex transferase subunit TsaD [Asaia krungthepensis]|uniref:tRNA (adenosine(37)-N6)-threonylcarbamoyltransferase complex transferase subunit TsaD n=1 Tax=Asaia krungthepensis TaxID=220990 RepID=UPI00223003D2|nr:tRNA (adenosine(37)-N6)-threonylcarbamoyltransferase complex transferase subunit TsaD [Asaia krungthepensis]